MVRLVPPTLAILCLPLSLGTSQEMAFVGTITDSSTGEPLSGVTVILVERAVSTLTNQDGRFRLGDIEEGQNTILVRYPGYEPWAVRLAVNIVQAGMIDIGPMSLSPLPAYQLDPVEVQAERVERWLEAFHHRRRTEKGTFITAEDIARIQPRRTSDLLRTVHGFRTLSDGDIASVRGVPSLLQGNSPCEVEYYINGVHSAMQSMDNLIPSAIAGIEIYRGPSTTPIVFQGTGNGKCGVIAIWTKNGDRALP